MKKLLIIIIILTTFANAQDKEPEPWEFIWGNSASKRIFELDSFPQTSFLTGFQWSGSNRMNNVLGNNASTICIKNLCFSLS